MVRKSAGADSVEPVEGLSMPALQVQNDGDDAESLQPLTDELHCVVLPAARRVIPVKPASSLTQALKNGVEAEVAWQVKADEEAAAAAADAAKTALLLTAAQDAADGDAATSPKADDLQNDGAVAAHVAATGELQNHGVVAAQDDDVAATDKLQN